MALGKKVVIIGGGFGGAAAAIKARSLLSIEHEVTLVDRCRRLHLCGMNPLLVIGQRESRKATRSLGLLANRGIRFVEAEVRNVDLHNRKLETSAGPEEFDYLVISAGADYDWEAVPGSKTAFSFYGIDTALRLKRKLSTFRKGRVVVGISSTPYKCPPAPFEAAMLLDWFFRDRKVRQNIEIDFATPEPAALPVAGQDAMARISEAFERKGIHLHTSAGVREVEPSGRGVALTDGTALRADLVITVPKHVPAPIVRHTALLGENGWAKVDPTTLATEVPGVYAIGDINAVPMADGRPIPKAGVFASAEGETVGHNIAAEINGTEPTRFPGNGYCFIAFSGRSSAAVTGNFLAPGQPDVRLTHPNSRGMRAKERFEHEWRRFRV